MGPGQRYRRLADYGRSLADYNDFPDLDTGHNVAELTLAVVQSPGTKKKSPIKWSIDLSATRTVAP